MTTSGPAGVVGYSGGGGEVVSLLASTLVLSESTLVGVGTGYPGGGEVVPCSESTPVGVGVGVSYPTGGGYSALFSVGVLAGGGYSKAGVVSWTASTLVEGGGVLSYSGLVGATYPPLEQSVPLASMWAEADTAMAVREKARIEETRILTGIMCMYVERGVYVCVWGGRKIETDFLLCFERDVFKLTSEYAELDAKTVSGEQEKKRLWGEFVEGEMRK